MIGEGVGQLREHAEMISEEAAIQAELEKKAGRGVEDNIVDIEKRNKDLRQAVRDSKSENRCCYMICCIVLLVIIGIALNLFL